MRLLILTQAIDRRDPVLGFFHRWVEELAEHFDQIEVVCLREGEHELPGNVSVHSLGKDQGKSRLTYIARFYKSIFSLDYDSVFVHMNPEYLVLGGAFWRLTGKRTTLWYAHRSVTWKLRLAAALVDSILTPSRESFHLRSHKVSVVGHGIDTDLFSPTSTIEPVLPIIATVGRISRIKNVDVLLKAVERFSSEHSAGVSLSMIGVAVTEDDRAYEAGLKRMVSNGPLSDRVSFEGPKSQAQVAAKLRNIRLFVNLSETGSLDKAVLEAMSVGTVSLSSNPGLKSVLDPFGLFIASV
ncbi:MAG: glycosyltransferase family 4 protein, partial [Patescibacteria group bacterium]|nr:glycosyltransferase family 4 protein [Patescibacteria group bacterium]